MAQADRDEGRRSDGMTPAERAELGEAHRVNTVFDICKMSRHSYGIPRIPNELRLGAGEGCAPTTVTRLM